MIGLELVEDSHLDTQHHMAETILLVGTEIVASEFNTSRVTAAG